MKLTKLTKTIIFISQLTACIASAAQNLPSTSPNQVADLALQSKPLSQDELSLETSQIDASDLELQDAKSMKRSTKIGIGILAGLGGVVAAGALAILLSSKKNNRKKLTTKNYLINAAPEDEGQENLPPTFDNFYTVLENKINPAHNQLINAKPLDLGIIFTNFETEEEFQNFLGVNICPFLEHFKYTSHTFSFNTVKSMNALTIIVSLPADHETLLDEFMKFENIKKLLEINYNENVVTFIINYEKPDTNISVTPPFMPHSDNYKRFVKRITNWLSDLKRYQFWSLNPPSKSFDFYAFDFCAFNINDLPIYLPKMLGIKPI